MAKRRRVPEVLWRLFQKRARTLSDTIISLLPPPTSSVVDCRCKGRRCLGCCAEEDRTSFLLRENDPPDYRKLLTRCFVVVSDNAPPVTAYYPNCRWSQLEIVRRTMEMILCEQLAPTNVICSGYDKLNRSSDIAELLTCSAWCLLLERVGDAVMVYLLKYTSVFLPLPHEKHHQVAGFPISNLCYKLSKHMPFTYPDPSSVLASSQAPKRNGKALMKLTERQQLSSSFGVDIPSSSVGCLGCKDRSNSALSCNRYMKNCFQKDVDSSGAETAIFEGSSNAVCPESSRQALAKPRKRSRYFRGQRKSKRRLLSSHETCSLLPCASNFSNSKNCSQEKLHEVDMGSSGAETTTVEEISSGVCDESSRQALGKSKKRLRYFSGQRKRKRRLLSSQEPSCLTPCATNLSYQDSFSGRHKNNNIKSPGPRQEKCSCCYVLQTLHKGSTELQINRQSIFYKMEHSKSVFPRTHIINSLKPNVAGATALFKDIFGTAVASTNAWSILYFHRDDQCLIGSTCLYHSLLRLLRILLHKARGFQHLRLLNKYCAIPFLDQNSNEGGVSMSEGNGCQINTCVKQNAGLKGKCQQHFEEHLGFDPKFCNISPKADILFEPSKFSCPKVNVVSFIWAVCRSIVPPDLLGTSCNWRILRRNIAKFVSLRRFEKFSLKQCMHRLRKSKFLFLSNKHFSCCLCNHVPGDAKGHYVNRHEESCEGKNGIDIIKQKLLECWIYWLYSCLVVPLLQANFYVTESEHAKQEVFYYQKSTWGKLMTRAISCLKDQSYHLLNESSIRKILTNRTFGFSKVRLRPKENGLRPLANLKAPSRMPVRQSWTMQKGWLQKKGRLRPGSVQYKQFKSVNVVLRDLHVILKDVQLKRPEKLGSSVFDYNDVYRKLRPFLSDLKSRLCVVPGVYMVVADVSKAFDSVNQDKLLSVMKDIILHDDYLLKKSQQVVSTKKKMKVCQNLILAHQNSGSSLSELTCSSHSIFVNQEWSRTVTKENLHFNLVEHVKRNVLQVDKRFYLQNVGIPQGSVLSSLLCSLYYGHLENSILFPFLEKSSEHGEEGLRGGHYNGEASLRCREDEIIFSSHEYILLRFVDDFLFLSTSMKQAAAYFWRLRRGFREYNCYMNEQKFGANFDVDQTSGFESSRIYVGEDGNSFLRWSGLFINCNTLEVQADYTRYLNTHLSSTLTVCWNGKPGRHLKAKLCDYLRPKCHPIFYDSNINSAVVVRVNIYQAFLVCAMKFHCYIRELSDICNLNSSLYMSSIHRSLRYMNKLIKKRMRSMKVDHNLRPVLQVAKGEVEWLGLTAYTRVFERKQSRYKELLTLLKLKLMKHCKENVSSVLKEAVDDSHSSVVWKIKY